MENETLEIDEIETLKQENHKLKVEMLKKEIVRSMELSDEVIPFVIGETAEDIENNALRFKKVAQDIAEKIVKDRMDLKAGSRAARASTAPPQESHENKILGLYSQYLKNTRGY